MLAQGPAGAGQAEEAGRAFLTYAHCGEMRAPAHPAYGAQHAYGGDGEQQAYRGNVSRPQLYHHDDAAPMHAYAGKGTWYRPLESLGSMCVGRSSGPSSKKIKWTVSEKAEVCAGVGRPFPFTGSSGRKSEEAMTSRLEQRFNSTFALPPHPKAPLASFVNEKHPTLPEQPDCSFFVSWGMCRFGAACKFNHPPVLVASQPHLFKLAFKLQQQILESKTLQELEHICSQSVSNFNHVNVSSVFRRTAKLLPHSTGGKSHSEQVDCAIRVLSQVTLRTKEILNVGGFDSEVFSSIWWCCGTLHPILCSSLQQAISDETLNILESKTIQALSNQSDKSVGRSVATFLWSKVVMDRSSFQSAAQETVLQHRILKEIENFNAMDLSQTIWALSKLECTPSAHLLDAFKARVGRIIHTYGPIDIGNSVAGLHRLGVDFEDLVPNILSRAEQVASGFNMRDICSFILPLVKGCKAGRGDSHPRHQAAVIRVLDKFLENTLASGGSGQAWTSNQQEICTFLRVFSIMRHNPSSLSTIYR